MSDKTDDLLISISTDLTTVRRGLKRLEADIAGSSKVIEQKFDGLGKNIDSSLTKSFRNVEAGMTRLTKVGSDAQAKFAKIFAVAASARGAQSLLDSATKIQNSLKVAGLEGDNLNKVYKQLFDSANRNGAPVEALATLYGRAAAAAKELGAGQEDLVKFSDGVAKALKVSGQSSAESAGALLQLGQAIAGGKVQSEEYNSLLDAGRPILQAVSAGMKEAGGSVAQLTLLVKAGKISSKAFFDAFLAGQDVLDKALSGTQQTIASRFTVLQNVMVDAAKRFNEGAEAGNAFGLAISSISDEIKGSDFDHLGKQLKEIADTLRDGSGGLQSWAKYIGQISGLDNIGKAIAGPKGRSFLGGAFTVNSTETPEDRALAVAKRRLEIEKEIAEIKANPFDTFGPVKIKQLEGERAALPAAKRQPGITMPAYALPGGTGVAPLPPITITDPKYKVVDPAEIERLKKAFDDLVKSADDRIGQMRQEIELTGQSGLAAETARFKLELLQKSEDHGKSLSEEQRKELEAKVELYDRYNAMLAKTKLSQDLLQDRRMSMMSTREQSIVTTQRQYGLTEDPNSPTGKEIGKSLDRQGLQDSISSFAMDFKNELLNDGGNIGKAFGKSIQTALMNEASKMWESLFKQLGGAVANAVFPASGGASNPAASLFGAAPIGAVTRAALPDVGAKTDIASYIASAATARGIDPAIALKVAKSEGGLSSWNMQSGYVKNGVQEPSFGPFQLYKGGGLGNDFMKKTGLDPALAQNGPAGVDFALDHASKNGWGSWYGADKVGVKKWDGIGVSSGMDTSVDAVNKMAEAAGSATKGLDSMAGGLGKLGQSLSSAFPAAPSSNGSGSLGWLGSLFSGPSLSAADVAKYTPMVGLFADGGPVSGPGSGTSDSIPTMLSNGEFVVNAQSSRKHRALLHAINTGTIGHMAMGGVAGRSLGAPVAPALASRRATGGGSGDSMLNVNISGANGDDHVRLLVKQGVGEALSAHNENQRRGGFGQMQQRYASQKG